LHNLGFDAFPAEKFQKKTGLSRFIR